MSTQTIDKVVHDSPTLSDQTEAIGLAKRAKSAFRNIRSANEKQKNECLANLAALLRSPQEQKQILSANLLDLENAKVSGLSSALVDRLTLTEKRISNIAGAVEEIISLADPVGEVVEGRTLKSGIEMIRKRVPLGVIFTIFESRPNVTIDIGALCIKSGNASILRGGKEAIHTNQALYALIKKSLSHAKLDPDSVILVEKTDRVLMNALLQLESLIDLVVPRGGEGLIRAVVENSKIPVVKHDKGVCNLYIEKSADLSMALSIAKNGKLQKPSVCNAVENLLIDSKFAHTKELLEGLKDAGAELLGDKRTVAISNAAKLIENEDQEYATEYLDNRLSVKIVDSLDDVSSFIYKYGSAHSEAIVSNDNEVIDRFIHSLDSAAIFVNCSTRFHDGGEMGYGAEVGISTGRLHVRGPMGLKDLTTTTFVVRGHGEVRS